MNIQLNTGYAINSECPLTRLESSYSRYSTKTRICSKNFVIIGESRREITITS